MQDVTLDFDEDFKHLRNDLLNILGIDMRKEEVEEESDQGNVEMKCGDNYLKHANVMNSEDLNAPLEVSEYSKNLMLQKQLKEDMIFPSIELALAYIYNWCDDNLSPLDILNNSVDFEAIDKWILRCPFEMVDRCPVMLTISKEPSGNFRISGLNLLHKNHEISYMLYQQFKKPKEIKKIGANHKLIVEGLFKCGFSLSNVLEYFSGYNSCSVSHKVLLNLCERIENGVTDKTLKCIELSCNVCDDKFRTDLKLKYHMELYHQVDNLPVNCGYSRCKITSINIQKHREHREEAHGNRAPCNECGKLIRYDNLNAHQSKMHSNIRKWHSCDYCDYQSSQKNNLKTHLNKHKDSKSFQCKLCDKKFNWDSSLRSHMSAAHGKIIRNYICEVCTHSFKDKSNLAQHMGLISKLDFRK